MHDVNSQQQAVANGKWPKGPEGQCNCKKTVVFCWNDFPSINRCKQMLFGSDFWEWLCLVSGMSRNSNVNKCCRPGSEHMIIKAMHPNATVNVVSGEKWHEVIAMARRSSNVFTCWCHCGRCEPCHDWRCSWAVQRRHLAPRMMFSTNSGYLGGKQ